MIRKRKLKNYLKKLFLLIYFEKTLFTYLLLKTHWYVKQIDYTYRFKLFPEIINQYSYKYKFFRYSRKKNRDCKIYSPYSQFIDKRFSFEREVIKNKALVFRLSEDNKNTESFFFTSKPKSSNTIPKFFIRKKF